MPIEVYSFFSGVGFLDLGFENAGFEILEADEAFCRICFSDVGAFVWFAHIIEWEFPGFSVDRCFDRLMKMQEAIEKSGCVAGRAHRYFIVAKNPEEQNQQNRSVRKES